MREAALEGAALERPVTANVLYLQVKLLSGLLLLHITVHCTGTMIDDYRNFDSLCINSVNKCYTYF